MRKMTLALAAVVMVAAATGGVIYQFTPWKSHTESTDAISGPALAVGDPSAGAKVFNKCKACHTVEEGGNHKIGPNLHNIVGRAAGTADGYRYSKSMSESGLTWDEATLFAYLENPRKYVKGTKMSFAGLKKPADRDNVVAYLKAPQ